MDESADKVNVEFADAISRRAFLGAGAAAVVAATQFAVAGNSPPESKTGAGTVHVGTEWEPVLPGIWHCVVANPESFTSVGLRRFSPLPEALARMPSIGIPPLLPPQATLDERGITIRLPLQAGENVYGLGLQMYSVNHRGSKKTLTVNADPRSDSGDSHAPVPIYISSLGYAIFADTARYATFCMGSARTADEADDKRRAATYITDVVNLSQTESAWWDDRDQS